MPPLKNAKHEAFALGIFNGKSARQAYLDAGYKCTPAAADSSGCDLLKSPKVAARVESLRERVADKVVLTKAWVIEQMVDTALAAKDDRQHSAATRALELLGREKGAFVESKRVSIRSFSDMSAEEIEEFLAGFAGPSEKPSNRRGKG